MKNILAALVPGSQVIDPASWKTRYGSAGYSRQGKVLAWLREKRIAFNANPRGRDLDVGLIKARIVRTSDSFMREEAMSWQR